MKTMRAYTEMDVVSVTGGQFGSGGVCGEREGHLLLVDSWLLRVMRNLGSYLNNLVLGGGGGLMLHFVKFLDHRLLLTFPSISVTPSRTSPASLEWGCYVG